MSVVEKVYLKKVYVLRTTFFGFLLGLVFGILLYFPLLLSANFTLGVIANFVGKVSQVTTATVSIPLTESSLWIYTLFVVPFFALVFGIFAFAFSIVYNFLSWVGADIPFGLMDTGETQTI